MSGYSLVYNANFIYRVHEIVSVYIIWYLDRTISKILTAHWEEWPHLITVTQHPATVTKIQPPTVANKYIFTTSNCRKYINTTSNYSKCSFSTSTTSYNAVVTLTRNCHSTVTHALPLNTTSYTLNFERHAGHFLNLLISWRRVTIYKDIGIHSKF